MSKLTVVPARDSVYGWSAAGCGARAATVATASALTKRATCEGIVNPVAAARGVCLQPPAAPTRPFEYLPGPHGNAGAARAPRTGRTDGARRRARGLRSHPVARRDDERLPSRQRAPSSRAQAGRARCRSAPSCSTCCERRSTSRASPTARSIRPSARSSRCGAPRGASSACRPTTRFSAAREIVGWRLIELDPPNVVRLAAAGMRLDLGGIAKGYILQEALRTLRAHGVTAHSSKLAATSLSATRLPASRVGRLQRQGLTPNLRDTRDRSPTPRSRRQDRPRSSSRSTACVTPTSIDPRTGFGVTSGRTILVIARDAAIADAVATALGVTGPAGLTALQSAFPDIVVSIVETSASK